MSKYNIIYSLFIVVTIINNKSSIKVDVSSNTIRSFHPIEFSDVKKSKFIFNKKEEGK